MIYLDRQSKRPLYEQLYENIKRDIETGKLPKNTPLGSLRTMCKDLQVSRNTVDRAYQQLIAEGYIRSMHGAGFFVEDISRDFAEKSAKTASVTQPDQKSRVKYDFEYASIDATLFPWNKWKSYVQNALIEESNNGTLTYETNKGNLLLRRSLCDFLQRRRGVNCTPDQVVVCAGTQYAMDILTNLLPHDRYRLAFEEPGYDAMRHLFYNRGYDIESIPVDMNGIDVQLLPQLDCNLLYITPSHQFPTGAVTPISSRQKILRWAVDNDAYIVENDYDSEFHYGMTPLPSLQSMDTGQRVIYTNTLSKVMSPSIRCAYLILPQALLPVYESKYRYFNAALPSAHQLALARFIEDGQLDRHLRKVSTINEKKYQVLVSAIREYLSDCVETFQNPAGVHTLVCIKNCTDQNKMIQRMKEASVLIQGTKEHWHDQKAAWEDVFLLGYNSMTEQQIRDGCKRMAEVLRDPLLQLPQVEMFGA